MKTCPACGNAFEDDVKFCPDDGSALKAKAQSTDPMMGRRLMDRWEVIERIGAGGFGTVYKVRDLRFDYMEALKVFDRRKLNPDEVDEAIARFRREAMLLKRLGNLSQNIVGVSNMEDDEEGGFIYFTMELVEGENLSQILVREGALHPDRASMIMRQICKALSVAHNYEEGIVHRDLKLENVMITRDKKDQEVVKILDFGIAKAIGQQSLTNLNMGGPGTPGYAAPEQVEGREIDQRTDLFALGVVFYGMLTGREPWLGGFITEPSSGGWTLLKQSVDGDPIPAHRWDPEIPKALEDICFKLLEKDPDNRYQSSEEIHDALVAWEEGDVVPMAALGSLRVLSKEPGVAIRVKQGVFKRVAEGRTPWEAESLEPGTYTVQVRDDRYEKESRDVEVTAEGAVEITLTAAPIVDARGSILVETPEEGVRVRLRDGLKSLGEGTTPWQAEYLPPGDYKIEIIDRQYARLSRPVRIVANEEANVQLKPQLSDDLSFVEKVKANAVMYGVGAVAIVLAAIFLPRFMGGSGTVVEFAEFEQNYLSAGQVQSVTPTRDVLIAIAATPEGIEALQIPMDGQPLQEIIRRIRDQNVALIEQGEGEIVFEPAFASGGFQTPVRFQLRAADGSDACGGECSVNEPIEVSAGWFTISHSSLEWDTDAVRTASDGMYGVEELPEDLTIFVPGNGTVRLDYALAPNEVGRALGEAQAELRRGTEASLGNAVRAVTRAVALAPDNPNAIAFQDSVANGFVRLARAELGRDARLAGRVALTCTEELENVDVTECETIRSEAATALTQQLAAAAAAPDQQTTTADGEVVATTPTNQADAFVQRANSLLQSGDIDGAGQQVGDCLLITQGADACVRARTRVVNAYLTRARSRLQSSSFANAQSDVDACLNLDSSNRECLGVRAGVSRRQGLQAVQNGQLAQAAEFAAACQRDNPGGSAGVDCAGVTREIGNRYAQQAATAFASGNTTQANRALDSCRTADQNNSECGEVRQAIADYQNAQSELRAERHQAALTLARQCLETIEGATACQTIVNQAQAALSAPDPAALYQSALGAFQADNLTQAESGVRDCLAADSGNRQCTALQGAIRNLRTAQGHVQGSRWEQARTAAQQCVSAVSGARPCSSIVTQANREIAAAQAAAEAAAAAARPSMTANVSGVEFTVNSSRDRFTMTPRLTASGSGPMCLVGLISNGNFAGEARGALTANGAGSASVEFDPENGDSFLPRSNNQGNFNYTVTVLVYGEACSSAPTGGEGTPLDSFETEVCFYRTIAGQWFAECPAP